MYMAQPSGKRLLLEFTPLEFETLYSLRPTLHH